jgi:hypothetical protein
MSSISMKDIKSMLTNGTDHSKDKESKGADARQHIYVTPLSEALICDVIVPKNEIGNVEEVPDINSLLKRLALDPQALGLANACELPSKMGDITVLPFRSGDQLVSPAVNACIDGSYPFCEGYEVFVSQTSSEEATNFLKAIGMPQGDWLALLRQYGLMPVSMQGKKPD